MDTNYFTALTLHLTLEERGAVITMYAWCVAWDRSYIEDAIEAGAILGISTQSVKRMSPKVLDAVQLLLDSKIEDEE